MRRPRSRADLGSWVIGLGCAWEALALATGRVPTWTRMVRRVPRPPRLLVVIAACGWLVRHMGPWR